MRKLTKDFETVPVFLKKQQVKLKNVSRETALSYDNKEVRKSLHAINKGKCAYCEERRILQIEHYRPKASVNSKDLLPKQNHEGYFWLKIEWSNLLYACHDCNYKGSKGTRFPLSNPKNRILKPIFDSENLPIYLNIRQLNALEQPLLINPEVDNPYLHLRINTFGQITPINNSVKGEISIQVYNLKRNSLLQKREKIINDFKIRIEKQLTKRYQENNRLTEAQFEEQLFDIFEDIAKQGSEEMEFTLISFSVLTNLEEMLLCDVDQIYHSQIKEIFIKFCETI